jgi:hypothetical protein
LPSITPSLISTRGTRAGSAARPRASALGHQLLVDREAGEVLDARAFSASWPMLTQVSV